MALSFVAVGNISPYRIAVVDSTAINAVKQSNATPGKPPAGVVSGQTDGPAGTVFNTGGYAAIAGESVLVFQVGDRCLVEAGNTISIGDPLKPDANGRALTATSGTYIVGIALEAATASNQFILCNVAPGYIA